MPQLWLEPVPAVPAELPEHGAAPGGGAGGVSGALLPRCLPPALRGGGSQWQVTINGVMFQFKENSKVIL